MASAHRYSWTRADGSKGKAWRAKWTGADGRPQSKRGFDRKGDAEAYADDREAEARHGITLEGERPSGRMTVKAWGDLWLTGLTVDPSTSANYGACLKRIYATHGDRPLASLRPSELRAWRKAMTERYAHSTTDVTAAVFGMLLKTAVEDGLLGRSPMPSARGAGRSTRTVDPDRLLTMEQVRAWDAALPPHARGMAVVAATTGLRSGELLGLRVEDVDFLRRRISVTSQLQNGTRKRPKTDAGVRTVPLSEAARDALAAYLAAYPPVDGEPIFRTSAGVRWRSSKGFWHCWATAARKARLHDWTDGDRRTRAGAAPWAHWHDLRDVMASALVRGGADIKTIMAIMGHASARETLETYARLWPDAQDVALKLLDGLLAGAPSDVAEGHGRATD